jgi:hypothetical protein
MIEMNKKQIELPRKLRLRKMQMIRRRKKDLPRKIRIKIDHHDYDLVNSCLVHVTNLLDI